MAGPAASKAERFRRPSGFECRAASDAERLRIWSNSPDKETADTMSPDPDIVHRRARGGVLVVGGGFGGAYVARELGRRGATVVNPQNAMLFTPMLPEVASGVIELRNAMMPLAMVCPDAELIVGRVARLILEERRAEVQSEGGPRLSVEYDHVVVGVGAVPRTIPIPGLAEHAVGCTTVLDALFLRNQLLTHLAAAAVESDPARRNRHLTFVFVGGGYAGVETLAELHGLAQDALRYHPTLRDVPQHWVLVDAAPKILADIPSRLGRYTSDVLSQRGVDLRLATRLEKVVDGRVSLSDGTELNAGLLVWTAGIMANPVVAEFGLPLDERGRVRVGRTLQVDGHRDVWALGDCAAVPNTATGVVDPPTSQHAIRQARHLTANLKAALDGRPLRPYRFRTLGQVAALGRREGIADLRGIRLKGLPGWLAARAVHVVQIPRTSRRLRVVSNWVVSRLFGADIVTFSGLIELPPLEGRNATQLSAVPRLPPPPADPADGNESPDTG
jgi:NADH:ubiquinone reductase (H+-translocating)